MISTWVGLALAGLKIISALLDWARSQQQFSAGQDAEIAKQALATLRLTDAGKRIMEKVDGLSRDSLDVLLSDLGTNDKQ